jgi:hypothetical protein
MELRLEPPPLCMGSLMVGTLPSIYVDGHEIVMFWWR